MTNKLIIKIGLLSRFIKQLIMLLADSLFLPFAIYLAFSIRYGYWYNLNAQELNLLLIAPLIAVPIFIKFGLYRAIIRYIGFNYIWTITQTVTIYVLVWGVVALSLRVDGFPRSLLFINWGLVMTFIIGTRLIAKWLLSETNSGKTNIAIYGAGAAGAQLISLLKTTNEFNTVAFIDDDNKLQSKEINGIKIYPPSKLSKLITDKNIKEVLLAIPSISRFKRNEIIKNLQSLPIVVRTLPGLSQLASGKIKVEDIRFVSIEDLLGRDTVPPNEQLLQTNIQNKVVLVTGAGGSIGSQLCRQILQLSPRKLILVEHSELALYQIEQELISQAIKVVPILASVADYPRMLLVCSKYQVQTIYHAAAYKHVPMIEHNITQGIQNNVFGTLHCVQAAIATKVEAFVLISTDKAVRPTNVMGASKRLAEMVIQALAERHQAIIFSMVRFGNVLGSSGSVIPFFKKQIKSGGPVTVTHPEIVRYFMTVAEAVQLVIQAGAMAKGGDVFVLDMGKPVLILDLAKKMINLSGLELKDKSNPKGDIEIKFTGLRPGEKLFEELLIGDNVSKTKHPMIMRAQENKLSWQELQQILNNLKNSISNNELQKIINLLTQAIPEYTPETKIKDKLN